MNLNQLYYFNELAKQHQFSKAAKHLHISQPSLSNSIKNLEKELDCALIKKANGRIELTEYGQLFSKTANSVINLLENTKRDINKIKRNKSNTIELGCIPSAIPAFLPHILSAFNKSKQEKINYIYHKSISEEICDKVRDGQYDLGICSKIKGYPNLVFIPVYAEDTIITAETQFSKSTRTIYLVYNPKNVLSKLINELINFIKKTRGKF